METLSVTNKTQKMRAFSKCVAEILVKKKIEKKNDTVYAKTEQKMRNYKSK